jgi:ABC-2 type transport system ATP-binding protein
MVWEHLGALRAEVGTTILVTTHLMEEAERYCERLAIMDMGRLVEQGAPAELLERHGTDSLEEVFTAVTGRARHQRAGGRIADVRAQRRVARRLS